MSRDTILFGSYYSLSQQFFARASHMQPQRKKLYDNLIRRLVGSGIWGKLDVLYIFATVDQTTALLNLVSSSFNGTANGSPTFTADAGFTGVDNSTTVYIDTGFNPTVGSPKYTQNSAHVSVWNNTNGTGRTAIGLQGGVGEISTRILPKLVTDDLSYFRINDNNGAVSTGVTGPADPRGLFLANRSGASAQQGYFRAVDQSVSAVSSGTLENANLYVLAYNAAGALSGTAQQIMAASIGGSLTAMEVLEFNSALHVYLQATAGITY